MGERIGAYVIDADGNTVPDMNDEAMSARQFPVGAENLQPLQRETQKELEVKDA